MTLGRFIPCDFSAMYAFSKTVRACSTLSLTISASKGLTARSEVCSSADEEMDGEKRW